LITEKSLPSEIPIGHPKTFRQNIEASHNKTLILAKILRNTYG